MEARTQHFQSASARALRDETLREALSLAGEGFVAGRARALAGVNDALSLRARATAARRRSVEEMKPLLLRFEEKALEQGMGVHWAEDARQARELILRLCRVRRDRAALVVKGKSMASEEIGLNEALEEAGLDVLETDLGEYIIQLAGETPSHIIAPAVHKTRAQIDALFRRHHKQASPLPSAVRPALELVEEARGVLRKHFLKGDVGITGANMLIAESGRIVLVTNEGNGDLCASLPKRHIVLVGIDKVVACSRDASAVLRVLARNATGQSLGTYVSLYGGPTENQDKDVHIVLLDNGRSRIQSSEWRSMLGCIRCGACLNHCPVYRSIGGQAYGWVYTGPMGKVLTPLLTDFTHAKALPSASSFCGRCVEVCPVGIPLVRLMRLHRARALQEKGGFAKRVLCKGLGVLWARPRLYRLCVRGFLLLLRLCGGGQGAARVFPFARAWTRTRDLPLNRSARPYLRGRGGQR